MIGADIIQIIHQILSSSELQGVAATIGIVGSTVTGATYLVHKISSRRDQSDEIKKLPEPRPNRYIPTHTPHDVKDPLIGSNFYYSPIRSFIRRYQTFDILKKIFARL